MLAGKSRPSVDIHIAERDLVIVTNNAWPEADAPVRKVLAKWNTASYQKKKRRSWRRFLFSLVLYQCGCCDES